MKIWLAGCDGPRRSARLVAASSAVMQLPGGPGRGLLGLLLAATLAGALAPAPEADDGEEQLVVVGALVAQVVDRGAARTRGRPAPGAGSCSRGLRAPRRPRRCGRRAAARTSALGRRPALVEVDGADDRLDGVGQDRRLRPTAAGVLALAERAARRPGRPPPPTSARAAALTTDARTLASSPSGMSPKVVVDVVGHDQAEHGVAEELEPLVRLVPGVLGAPRPVRDREREQIGRR